MQNCQNGTDVSKCGCCVEDNVEEVAKAIKAIDPTTMVFAYIHSGIHSNLGMFILSTNSVINM